MKCDELEEEYLWTNNVKTPSTRMVRAYSADDVDKAIAELKQKLSEKDEEIYNQKWRGDEWARFCNQKDKEIESLKASHYAEMVDAGMRERRLRRALYKACANWAHEKDARYYLKYVCISDDARIQYERWRKMEHKCLKKAEEYK